MSEVRMKLLSSFAVLRARNDYHTDAVRRSGYRTARALGLADAVRPFVAG